MATTFKNKKVVIVGLGRYEQGSGSMAVQYFSRHGAELLVTDKNTAQNLSATLVRLKDCKNITYSLGNDTDPALLDDADFVFQNPAVPDTHPLIKLAVKKKIPVINDWTLFFMHKKANCIGVTGTRGKTTTTMLLFTMVQTINKRARLAGNVGVSPLAFLDEYKGELVVAEFSSWLLRGLRSVKKSPHVAVFTNLMHDHQNMYPSMTAYGNDKKLIFEFQKKKDTLVLNGDNAYTKKLVTKMKGKRNLLVVTKNPKGLRDGILIDGGLRVFEKGKERFGIPGSSIVLQGEHNWYNAACASAAASVCGVSWNNIEKVLKNFKGVPYRLETVAEKNNITYINDTTATTPDAAIVALQTLATKKVTLICGGADKELEYSAWGKEVARNAAHTILIPGNASDKMKIELEKNQYRFETAKTLADAVKKAEKITKKDGVILLSPGAASFNMFKNEFDRGDQFNALVK